MAKPDGLGRAGAISAGGSSGGQLTGDLIDDLVAELVAYGCGSWREVMEHMGPREAAAMGRAWEYCPPVPAMVARYFGVPPKRTKQSQEEALAELVAMFGVTPGGSATMK